MCSNDELEKVFMDTGVVDFVKVDGDGYHYHATIVSQVFEGLSKVARQQWVYARVNDLITSGAVHALNMNTFTKSEWEKQRG